MSVPMTKTCKESGHKMMDCPQDFHDNEADDKQPVHNGDNSTEIQPLLENTETTTQSKPETIPHVSKLHNMGTTNSMLTGQVNRKM